MGFPGAAGEPESFPEREAGASVPVPAGKGPGMYKPLPRL